MLPDPGKDVLGNGSVGLVEAVRRDAKRETVKVILDVFPTKHFARGVLDDRGISHRVVDKPVDASDKLKGLFAKFSEASKKIIIGSLSRGEGDHDLTSTRGVAEDDIAQEAIVSEKVIGRDVKLVKKRFHLGEYRTHFFRHQVALVDINDRGEVTALAKTKLTMSVDEIHPRTISIRQGIRMDFDIATEKRTKIISFQFQLIIKREVLEATAATITKMRASRSHF